MKRGPSRREVLKTLGAVTGAAALGPSVIGCAADAGATTKPTEGITTLVVLCMENRSYDHYFGARTLVEGRGGDGLTADMYNLDLAGNQVQVFAGDAACVDDPAHSWVASRSQFAAATNSGFLKVYEQQYGKNIQPSVLGYLGRKDLPVTYALADSGVVCDRWFCSVMGPTWPNRMYLMAGQSGGAKTNDVPPGGLFMFPTIFHRLNDAGIPWRYYFGDLPFVPLFKDADPNNYSSFYDVAFLDDAAHGALPPVVFIDPTFARNDDHPPHHPVFGQQLIAEIYTALATSPQWNNILFVVTYDEHGGFFDHVPPPKAPDERAADGFDQLGFRVPAMILGPYVKPGQVVSTQFDHTSVLAHIEQMHGLAPLTMRDAAANDLTSALDLDRLAALKPLPPIQLPEVTVPASLPGC
jgi:phospholipase C